MRTELTYKINDTYELYIQMNSDDDFDYEVFKNDEEYDGGILENINYLDSITDEIFNEILNAVKEDLNI